MFESWFKYKLGEGTAQDLRDTKVKLIDAPIDSYELHVKNQPTQEDQEKKQLEAQRIFEESCHCLNYFEGILKQFYMNIGSGLDNALNELKTHVPEELAAFGVNENTRAFHGDTEEVKKSLVAMALLVTMDSSSKGFTSAVSIVHVDGLVYKLSIRPVETIDLDSVLTNALSSLQRCQPSLGPLKHYLPKCTVFCEYNGSIFFGFEKTERPVASITNFLHTKKAKSKRNSRRNSGSV